MKLNSNSDNFTLIRLFSSNKEKIINHLVNLPDEDRSLRFNGGVSPHSISKYVENSLATINTRTNADFWFGMTLNNKLISTLHIAIRKDTAEFAFSTDSKHRGKKLVQLLFARGYQLVTEYSIDKIYLTCLSRNKAMQHIAKKFGLQFTYNGTEIEALTHVPNPVSIQDIYLIKNNLSTQES